MHQRIEIKDTKEALDKIEEEQNKSKTTAQQAATDLQTWRRRYEGQLEK